MHDTKADAVVVAAIEAGVPSPCEARTLIDQFHDMVRKTDEDKLDSWIANIKIKPRLILRDGSPKDSAAVRAAITPLFKRPSRRADYETQTRKTANLWARQN
ncbi:hypothetical protein [Bradyrhizobium sp. LB11.1]|uniref:hypothetical protein n=1 Tax=Bradyrhizobium sp. LB11.1 TaxID=3156326 RepID=UPI003391AABE